VSPTDVPKHEVCVMTKYISFNILTIGTARMSLALSKSAARMGL
jgi:hypothetical protein